MTKKSKPIIYIIYSLFLTEKGDRVVIGGIQKYILGLINVFYKNYDVKIIQKANINFERTLDNYQVLGFKVDDNKKIGKELYSKIESKVNESDYIIWGTDRISEKIKHKKTISIQHGITFDFIDYSNIKYGSLLKKSLTLSVIYRLFQYFNAVKFFLRASKVVCVDYNFLNWIRTILPRSLTKRAIVITNYSELPDSTLINNKKNIKILFARRFVEYRGVYILCEIIENISKKYNNVEFGIYGEGPLEGFLTEKLKNYKNVTISSFSSEEALEIPLSYSISLIPTYGSEGTSLSLIESMACGCVPIASNIGGMTNVILDGYNGFLVSPNSKEFCNKLEFLINNQQDLEVMSRNARYSIEKSFSFKKWANQWNEVIKLKN